jgi:hypothetical protein
MNSIKNSQDCENAQTGQTDVPPSRLSRWVAFCDELSAALLATGRQLLAASADANERLDHLKELVNIGYRLFALERTLAATPALAGDAAPTNSVELGEQIAQFLQLARQISAPHENLLAGCEAEVAATEFSPAAPGADLSRASGDDLE